MERPLDPPESHDHEPTNPFLRLFFFGNFNADRVALPTAIKPSSNTAHLRWILFLPSSLSTALLDNFNDIFDRPFIHAVNSSPSRPPLPRNHCKQADFPKLLARMHDAGLLVWRLEADPKTPQSSFTAIIEVTLFAVSKSHYKELMISSPGLVNRFCEDPPAPDIPESSLLSFIKAWPGKLSGFYLEVSNIFHNLPLRPPFHDLFPHPTVCFADLPGQTRNSILDQLNLTYLPPDASLLPAQFTAPGLHLVGYHFPSARLLYLPKRF